MAGGRRRPAPQTTKREIATSVWDFKVFIGRLILRGDDESLAQAVQILAPALDGQLQFSQPSVPVWCLMLIPPVRAGEVEQVHPYCTTQPP